MYYYQKIGIVIVTSLLSLFTVAQADAYQWQGVSINYHAPWQIVTDRLISGKKVIHFSYSKHDHFPISVVLQLEMVPSNVPMENRVDAMNFAWPVIQRFTKRVERKDSFFVYDQLVVARQVAPAMTIISPTPVEGVFIAGQVFMLQKGAYRIKGILITRTDKGNPRKSKAYRLQVQSAYQLLQSIRLSP